MIVKVEPFIQHGDIESGYLESMDYIDDVFNSDVNQINGELHIKLNMS